MDLFKCNKLCEISCLFKSDWNLGPASCTNRFLGEFLYKNLKQIFIRFSSYSNLFLFVWRLLLHSEIKKLLSSDGDRTHDTEETTTPENHCLRPLGHAFKLLCASFILMIRSLVEDFQCFLIKVYVF